MATEHEAVLPDRLTVHQNYPNPFTGSTTIRYELPEAMEVRLLVFDALGRQVAKLVDKWHGAGTFDVKWNAEGLGSGAYFYQLDTGGFVETRSMFLARATQSVR